MTNKLINFAGWSIVLAASLYFVFHNAIHYFSYDAKSYGAEYWPTYASILLTHITFGLIALLIGPFQFIATFRKKYPQAHRTMGKIYLVSIALAGSASLYLSIGKIIMAEKDIVFGTGLLGLALAWLLTSSMAYWAIRCRNFVQHREWMVRSFVVTCGFTSFRLIFRLLVDQLHVDPAMAGNTMAWACWAFPLLVTEGFLQGIKIKRGRVAPAAKAAH